MTHQPSRLWSTIVLLSTVTIACTYPACAKPQPKSTISIDSKLLVPTDRLTLSLIKTGTKLPSIKSSKSSDRQLAKISGSDRGKIDSRSLSGLSNFIDRDRNVSRTTDLSAINRLIK
jgi:hypothetical protein